MSETVTFGNVLGTAIVYNDVYSDFKWHDNEGYEPDSPHYLTQEALDEFHATYKIHDHDYIAEENFYHGTPFTRVIERKSDGKLFGYTYWQGGGKYGEMHVEANGDDYESFLFHEVEQFQITGFRVVSRDKGTTIRSVPGGTITSIGLQRTSVLLSDAEKRIFPLTIFPEH